MTLSVEHLTFATLVGEQALPAETLERLTGDASYSNPGFRSGLTLLIAAAWKKPLTELTCAQVRVLVGQRLGLQWLAAPVATFVRSSPGVECDLYPGDLTAAAFHACDDLLRHAPEETRAFLAADPSWMAKTYDWDPAFLSKMQAALAVARAKASRE